ncbi:DUF1735 domain-containing protein [Prolixibacteraceae bacterium JC049]|nr:DUF1735 domain-containing protein [Prolixibacteraceae bacterium JC049]
MKRINIKVLLAALLFSPLLVFVSCEDNRDEFLSDYNTIVYFLRSGELPIKVYDMGEDTNYKVTVGKGGSDLKTSSSCDVEVMSTEALATYNTENGKQYVLLPQNCYQFEKQTVDLTQNSPYKELNVALKTDLIVGLPEVEGKYVLPIGLQNGSDSINTSKKYAFIVPNILTPKVFFPKKIHDDVVFTAESEAQIKFEVPVEIPSDLVISADFTATLAIDEQLVNEYNQQFGTSYKLLPASAYAMNKDIAIKTETTSGATEVVITRTDLKFGNYILPLRIANSSKEQIKIDQEKATYMVPISYTPPVPPVITLNADMISSNAQEQYEGPLANILDGNRETFFHSSWSKNFFSPYGHYIDFALEAPIDLLQFSYTTRHNNGNGAPKVVVLYGSNDNQTWNKITTINRGLPQNAAADYTSNVFQADAPFKYLRFAVNESASGKMNESESQFFSIAEFTLRGQLSN